MDVDNDATLELLNGIGDQVARLRDCTVAWKLETLGNTEAAHIGYSGAYIKAWPLLTNVQYQIAE